MSQYIPNFREEQSAKIPALTLFTNLGYQFIAPSDCLNIRGKSSTVILPNVLRDVLKHKTYSFMGKEHPLSDTAIDKIVHELASPAMNKGLKAANEKLYTRLPMGLVLLSLLMAKKRTQPFK